MGSNFATELADNELLDLDLETQIGIHLSANHYPPVPSSMIQPCIDAIDAYYDEDYNRLIVLIKAVDNHPSGVNRVLLDVNGTERWTSVSN